MSTPPAREYAQARAVLLDALDALGPHRHSVILVGAQAVYLHSGDSDFAVAPMTTDSDLALRVNTLEPEPGIAAALTAAGFTPARQPGSWLGCGDIADPADANTRWAVAVAAARLSGDDDPCVIARDGLAADPVDATLWVLLGYLHRFKGDESQTRMVWSGGAARTGAGGTSNPRTAAWRANPLAGASDTQDAVAMLGSAVGQASPRSRTTSFPQPLQAGYPISGRLTARVAHH